MPKKDNPQYLADMSFGFGEEDRIQPFLEERFGVLHKLDKYHPFDFENDEFIIEVKSRRIPHNNLLYLPSADYLPAIGSPSKLYAFF